MLWWSLGEARNDALEFENMTDNLPARFKYSSHGDIIIENFVFTDEEIILTYKVEGMAGDLTVDLLDENEELITMVTFNIPIYDGATGLYTAKIPNFPMRSNEEENIKKFSVRLYEIELLENQAIIIPLK